MTGFQSRPVVRKHEQASESPGWLVTTQTAGPTPRVHDSAGLGWDQESGLFMFPGDTAAADRTLRIMVPTPVKSKAPLISSALSQVPAPAHQVGGRSFFFTPR